MGSLFCETVATIGSLVDSGIRSTIQPYRPVILQQPAAELDHPISAQPVPELVCEGLAQTRFPGRHRPGRPLQYSPCGRKFKRADPRSSGRSAFAMGSCKLLLASVGPAPPRGGGKRELPGEASRSRSFATREPREDRLKAGLRTKIRAEARTPNAAEVEAASSRLDPTRQDAASTCVEAASSRLDPTRHAAGCRVYLKGGLGASGIRAAARPRRGSYSAGG